MLCSLQADLIAFEIKRGQCLQNKVSKRLNRMKSGADCVTVFCCKAFAICFAPSSSILQERSSSVTSACREKVIEWLNNKRKNSEDCTTLFCCRPRARSSAPCTSILLPEMESLLNAYVDFSE
jgi:hypothetical protein